MWIYIYNAYMWVPACVETSGLPWVFFNAIPLTDRLFLRQGLPLGLESDDRLSRLTRQAPRVPPAYALPGVEIRACCTMPRNFQMHSGAVLRLPCLYQSTLPTEGCFLLYFCLRIFIETGYSYMTQANWLWSSCLHLPSLDSKCITVLVWGLFWKYTIYHRKAKDPL